jgi:hypothetical protein
MILLDEDPATREMDTDPSFTPCRDEHCSITELHREHSRKRKFARPSAKRLRDCCPKCGAGIVYIANGDHQRAHCPAPACGWRGYFISKTKENESARNQP